MPANRRPAVPFAVHPTAADALREVLAREQRARGAVDAWDPARHAAGRFGFGVNYFGSKPAYFPDQWWASQVAYGKGQPGYAAMSGLTSAFPTLPLNPPKTAAWLKKNVGNAQSYAAMQQLLGATLVLQSFSRAQLYEAVVDVLSNHINIANMTPIGTNLRTTFDRDTIRAHAFGKYRDLLAASARDVLLQRSLGLSQSSKNDLNENYGREILELHTVGVSAGYTQSDVVAAARALTGRFRTTEYLYQYFGGRHWTGRINVLGFSAANDTAAGGERVGDAMIAYLACHPATARNLATKFCRRFVSDTPSEALVQAVADAYLANDTAILPALSVIFRSTEFWASHGLKVRRPAESVVATVRALGLQPGQDLAATGTALTEMCTAAGQVPLSWPAPDGFPDVATAWSSAGGLLSTWTFQRNLVTGRWSSAFKPWSPQSVLNGAKPRTTGDVVSTLARNLVGSQLATSQRAAMVGYLGVSDSTPAKSSGASTHELRNLVALLLHGPQHSSR